MVISHAWTERPRAGELEAVVEFDKLFAGLDRQSRLLLLELNRESIGSGRTSHKSAARPARAGVGPRQTVQYPYRPRLTGFGAGEGNRTLVVSLEGFCSTIELHPQGSWIPNNCYNLHSGGGGWIRTNVGVSQQIYSLPPLATRAPLHKEL